MKELNKQNKEYVRIIIGRVIKGKKNMEKPTITITLVDTNTEEVEAMIRKAINEESSQK